jgi:arylesterase / paraoxonase
VDAFGNLWVAAHPKMLVFLDHAKDGSNRSPSEVLKITISEDGSTGTVEQVYVNDGDPLSGSSVATVFDNKILVGGVFDDGVLVGKIKN